ncbi:amino acid adenylation domain-containing protein [Pendulispora brunnea]|uniref:Amino acid adenylation domain-containing protein n=1 Tax=Pendulispora brunnea TaxID=2905690 RepID=A0ABZ2KIT9_9BACT
MTEHRSQGMTDGQRALWFLDKLAPERRASTVARAFRFYSDVDERALEQALNELPARHPSLRSVFPLEGDGPVRRVLPAMEPWIRRISGECLSDEQVRALLSEEAARPFDLERGPVARAVLVTQGSRGTVLLFAVHHIVTDLGSLLILADDLARLYGHAHEGAMPPFTADEDPWAAYVQNEEAYLEGPDGKAAAAYWKERLAGDLPPLDLPADRPRPAVPSFRGKRATFALPAQSSAALAAFARKHGVTPYVALLTVFYALLYRYSGRSDLVVGTPTVGRERFALRRATGYFVNPIAIRASVDEHQGFLQLLETVRQSVKDGLKHRRIPFPRVASGIRANRDLPHAPVFQVLFQWLAAPGDEALGLNALAIDQPGHVCQLGALKVEAFPLDRLSIEFDLAISLAETPGGIGAAIEYSLDRFEPETIRRLWDHYERLLASALLEPDRPIVQLRLIGQRERRTLLDWSTTEAVAPLAPACLHQLVEEQAARTPEAVALRFQDRELTYRDLNARANQLARSLRTRRVGPETRVGIRMARSEALVVALLAVLKAGGAYVPLDPSYPEARVRAMLEDSGAKLVLTESDVHLDAIDQASQENLPCETTAGSLAYLIFTSGSTGRPKGVAIEHRSAVARMAWARTRFSQDELACVLASTSICFDLSVFELFAPLSVGGTVVLVADALALAEMPDAGIRLVNTVPSAMAALVHARALPPSVCTVNLAGEALPGELVRATYRGGHVTRLYNLYGPSEDTTYSTEELVALDVPLSVPIGRPLPGTRAYVVDARGELAPIGVPGELYLGGVGLSRGYIGRPELTAERFVPDAFGEVSGARLYRTGDRVRWNTRGVLEFLGRNDEQVKVRGHRIELGEVSAAMTAHAREAAVVVERDAGSGARLLGYWVARAEGPHDAEGLRAALGKLLPGYMVPSVLVRLDALPRTPNGKIDRAALPRPAAAEPVRASFVEPRDAQERLVATVFEELLGIPRAGAEDDFFELGGHSLLATRAVARLREATAIDLPLRTLFEAPTVAALARRLDARGGAQRAAIAPAGRAHPLPLSFSQERLWFLMQLDPASTAYNMPAAVKLRGPLDEGALVRALESVVARHEVLRTRFITRDGRPFQVPAADIDFHVDIEDGGVEHLALAHANHVFRVADGELLRATLVRLGPEEHVLLLTLHHLVADGWSLGVLLREVAAHYTSAALPPLPIQYADYASWQRDPSRERALDAQKDYFKSILEGAPSSIALLGDRPRPAVQSTRGARLDWALDAGMRHAVEALARKHGVTAFMVLFAMFAGWLHRYTHQNDLVIGSPVANRTHAETEGLIGFFVNLLPLRANAAHDPTFLEFVHRIRETALGAYENQDVPFEQLVEALQPARDPSYTPLFNVTFALQNTPFPRLELGNVQLEVLPHVTTTSKFDLSLSISDHGHGEWLASFDYCTDLFEPATVERMAVHFERFARSAMANPGQRLSELPLLSSEERRTLLQTWNDTAVALPREACVHRWVEARVRLTPDAVALSDASETITYAELDARANRLAHWLVRQKVNPASLVGICLPRSARLAVAALGVLKAGCAYVPMDPAHPSERHDAVIRDTGMAALITGAGMREGLPAELPRTLFVDSDETLSEPTAPVDRAASATDLAYVIYTSGSTGRPKGVPIAHAGLGNLVAWHLRVHTVTAADRATLIAGPAFDASVWELWPYLAAGASVHVPDEEIRTSPERLVAWLAAKGITMAFLPTPLAEEVLAQELPGNLALRSLLTGGDRLHPVHRALPFALFNHYGPTEGTVVATWARVEPGANAPPIGAPIDNMRAYVLDAHGEPVPQGVPGELYLGGIGLSPGYIGRPELTAERFVPDPFSGTPGARLYRTGDWVRWRAGGVLEFLGRDDDQVKVRGHRIELGDVSTALMAHAREATVIVERGERTSARLLGYWVPRPGGPTEAASLRAALVKQLPGYMIPSVLTPLDALPRTPNGKIDHAALPRPAESAHAYVAPRDAREALVARVFEEVLGVPRVGADDDFFALGGHSLLATRAIARLRDETAIDLPLRELFESPTVSAIAALLTRRATEPRETIVRTISKTEDLLARLENLPECELDEALEALQREEDAAQ